MSASTAQVAMWDDDNVELNDKRPKRNIPPIPTIDLELQTVKGKGMECLAYLALQCVKTQDKVVFIRAVASAVSVLLQDSTNFTGSKVLTQELTGLSAAAADDADPSTELQTNFEDAEPVTIGELLETMNMDSDELGAYFGVMFLAGTKRITTKNRTAFNEKRQSSATASIIGEAKIFVTDSPYLTDAIMQKVYASFLSCSPIRANMIYLIIHRMNKAHMGPSLAFMNMFLLLVDSGLSALRMIKEAVVKHPWMRTEFPELKPEFSAANDGIKAIKVAPGLERSFLKAIHGNAFVPVNYSDIDNLTGVAKEILKRTTPSYQNYDGGKITEAQDAVIRKHLGQDSVLAEAPPAE
jgi:hypothetical protein